MSRPSANDAGTQLVLLRYSGDISTKAKGTRYRMVRRLTSNLQAALASEGHGAEIRVSHDRIFVELPRGMDAEVLTRVFGIQSVSPVERRVGTELEEVVRAGVELFADRVRGRRFAVRARRVGDRSRIALNAREVERALGAALLPHAHGVDLDHPEITVRLELLEEETYFFPENLAAPGGLPLGVEGRALALMSGGFDSAVAAWHMARRGVSLDYVFCNLGGATHQQGTLRVVKALVDRWSHGDEQRFYALDFAPLASNLQEKTETRYWQVLLKRLMLRAADRIARRRHALALVTGEAVGQVSSQTLQNLAVISQATNLTILRPLVGFNKEEIIARAREIGTHDLSAVVGEYCAMVPSKPATAASLRAVIAEEEKLDLSLVDRAVAEREVIDLRTLDVEKLELPDLETSRVPEGATVIDLRTRAEFQGWHHPDALHMDFSRAMAAYASFDKRKHFILYCEIGLKSAHLAELMRREGFEAHHFRGGLRAVRRAAERR